MLLDLAALKERLGIPPGDVTKDPLITLAAEQAQALAETYCDRGFELLEETESFPEVSRSFQVHRYPIESIALITTGSDLDDPPAASASLTGYRVDAAKGIVWPAPYRSGRWPVMRCQYTGGFAIAPPDLYWALLQIFDSVWAATPGGALPPGASGGGAFDSVKKFSVVGAYSVELASSGDAGGGSGGSDGDNNWGILGPPETAVLDRYRRASVLGIS